MSCQYSKFVGVPAGKLARLMGFIASQMNTGKASMYLLGTNGAHWAEGPYTYQHVSLVETKPGNTPQLFNVTLLIEHFFVPVNDNHADSSKKGWHMSDTNAPRLVPREVINTVYDALGLFPKEPTATQFPDRGGGVLHRSGRVVRGGGGSA